MRRVVSRIAIIYLSLLGVLLLPAGARADGARLSISPANGTVGLDGTVAVAVRITDVVELYGYDIRLSYDPAVLQVVDADPTLDGVQVQPGTLLSYDFSVRNFADNATGEVWFALAQLNPSAPATGSGDAMTIIFRGVQEGAISVIDVTSFKLSTRTGDTIAASAEGGQVAVVAPPLAPPTPTNAPPPPTPVLILPTSTPDAAQPTATPRPPTRTPAPLGQPTPTITLTPTIRAQQTNTPAALAAAGAAPATATQSPPAVGAVGTAPTLTPQPTATAAAVAAALPPAAAPTASTAGTGLFRGEGALLPGLETAVGLVLLAGLVFGIRWLKRRRTP